MFRFSHIAYFLIVFCCAFTRVAQAQTEVWLDAFLNKVEQQVSKAKVPGYSMVYVEAGEEPRYFSYGLTEAKGKPVDEFTLFRLASVSKTFTGGLAGKLVEQGKLDWQTSISQLAPEFGWDQAGKANITLEHVLSQSSGLVPNAYDNLIEANYSFNRILNKLADLQPLCQPGECYTYQNALFGVLEHHFRLNNVSYSKLLEEELLKPLNMRYTSVGKSPLESSTTWAKPHVLTRNKTWRKTRVSNSYYRFAPAAGVNTNATDMGIWLKAMLGERPDVISSKVVNDITTPRVRTTRELRRRGWRGHIQDAHYGYGWRVYDFDGHKLNYHSGWVKGYRAEVAFSPETGAGFAILMNAESNIINQIGAEFWISYFDQHQASKLTVKNERQPVE
ncbi:beta-lactamase family protein [Alteromonas sp. a30]|nr:beta-lactamase family protein [Alteromonas sp. a30]